MKKISKRIEPDDDDTGYVITRIGIAAIVLIVLLDGTTVGQVWKWVMT